MWRTRVSVAVVVMQSLLGGCREVNARRNIQEGNKLYYKGKYAEAIEYYDQALEDEPRLAIGWYNLGVAHKAAFSPGVNTPANKAHEKGGIAAFEKYLNMVPSDGTARKTLLQMYRDAGNFDGIISYWLSVLGKNPTDALAVQELATACSEAGRFDEAIKWYRRSAELADSNDLKANQWYAIGVMNWRRLNKRTDILPEDRVRISDEGLAALQAADQLRANHGGTLAYINLLYRERGVAHGASYARVVETATAQVYQKQAEAALKAQSAAAASQPQQPPPKKK